MATFQNVLCAVIDFLNNAESLGIVKEFTLIQNEVNYSEVPGAESLLNRFLESINGTPVLSKNSSSDEEYIIIDDEKRSESDTTIESPSKENREIQTPSSELDGESFVSSATEQASEEDKKPESMDVFSSDEKVHPESTAEKSKLLDDTKEADSLESPLKKNLVQINVDTEEMKKRIAACMSRKRKEVDEWNVQEFCGRSYIDEQDPAIENVSSCARVDAVFVPRRGSASHIIVSRVHNAAGPQTPWLTEKKIKQEPVESDSLQNDSILRGIDERLLNMETHLKLKSDSSLRANIFKRLRNLEDRILLLESTSPEYVQKLNPESSPKKKRMKSEDKTFANISIEELRSRIQTVKESLKMKSFQIKKEQNV